jgi:DNA-binding IclR family transcriptional regulator
MSGLQRYLDILHLFDAESGAWTIPSIAGALSVPASTIYRTVRELVQAGLLEAAGESRYRLGVTFVEFDRKIRMTDPLIRVGQSVLSEIVEQAHMPCVALLSRLYGSKVICIASETAGHMDFESSYERGKPMPLTRGATSKVILAQLPPSRLEKLLGKNSRGGEDPKSLRELLLEIRKRGYAVTHGEIDTGLAGLAAPVLCQEVGVLASLSLVVRARYLGAGTERRLVMLLMSAAKLLSESLSQGVKDEARLPQPIFESDSP